MQNNVADGIAAVASHPITVQVFNQGPGILGNIATGLLAAGTAIVAVRLTHRFTLEREKQATEDKRQRELHYICTELVFLLERYAEGCAQVADDDGEKIKVTGKQAERIPGAGYPAPLNFDNVAGDWRSLPPARMYNIRELPLRQAEAMGVIGDAQEYATPGDYPEFFRARQYQFALLGMKAISEARLLRKLCALPPSRLNTSTWSAQPVMVRVWKRERRQQREEHPASQRDDEI